MTLNTCMNTCMNTCVFGRAHPLAPTLTLSQHVHAYMYMYVVLHASIRSHVGLTNFCCYLINSPCTSLLACYPEALASLHPWLAAFELSAWLTLGSLVAACTFCFVTLRCLVIPLQTKSWLVNESRPHVHRNHLVLLGYGPSASLNRCTHGRLRTN